jgi:hypothetical protein
VGFRLLGNADPSGLTGVVCDGGILEVPRPGVPLTWFPLTWFPLTWFPLTWFPLTWLPLGFG